jgi:hypothetical protein
VGASSQHDPTGCEFTGESPCSISEGKAYIFNPKNGSLVRTPRLPREDVPGPTEDNPDGGCHVLSSSAQGGTYVMNGANGSPLKSLELPKTCEQPSSRQNRAPVFISRPAVLTETQQVLESEWSIGIAGLGFAPVAVPRSDYGPWPWQQLRRAIHAADGAVVLGFGQLLVQAGRWRPGTRESASAASRIQHPGISWRRG